MSKKIKILIISIFLVFAVAIAIFYFIKPTKSGCLSDNSVTTYENDKDNTYIVVSDKKTGQEINRFQIKNIITDHYHGQELHKCNFYVIRQFNYDSKTRRKTPNYSAELWSYNYTQNGLSILTFSKTDNNGNYLLFFNDDFRISPDEKYLALEKGYAGQDDYSIVIKTLSDKKDAFIISAKELSQKYPDIVGNFGLKEWTKDGRYFWGNIFDGADVLAFFRIEIGTWKWEVFEAPVGTMGGDVLNPELGYVTYDDGSPWTGFADLDQAYREQWKKEGKIVHFYLYNLFTKEKTLLATYDDPTYFTKPKWLSDTQLQYEMPNGEKRIYEIK
ncbi:MAG: hypothetical protein Athens071424_4 [Parcubacteria group bacterium Athens0714_24]|nr:MAG: hypothetical protein Athens071424_4 [Parcubacteria group bacterium Athens0714_24]